jgi:signal transduction histidine kinase
MQYHYYLYGMRVTADLDFVQLDPVRLPEDDRDFGREKVRIRAMDEEEEAQFRKEHGDCVCGSFLGTEKGWLCNRTLAMSVERGQVIRDMYELFTLEDPSHAFSFQELDAPAFLEEYFYTALPDSHYAGHLLCLSVSQDLHATLFADPGKLIRILDNLLSNAAKYAPAGTKITLSAAPSADLTSLRISVTDEGPGIPPEDLERIFNRTYTVSSARTPGSATGSGLGLAIVKTITERHGGTVSCENAPGAGSIFSVTLPAKFLQS